MLLQSILIRPYHTYSLCKHVLFPLTWPNGIWPGIPRYFLSSVITSEYKPAIRGFNGFTAT